MEINEAVIAIEQALATYDGGGTKPVASQVRPSGDDINVIKIWVDLGDAKADRDAWETTCEAALRKAVPGARAFKLQIRAE